ncbi:ABC transporter substrate-binding protein [Rhodoblastus sp.]|uniref:ABC transporter substrate-binding protein n=1 Tax=Rhodoblastus sp. TaxID=1962975 RepID=UPI002613FCF1|nr:ABC transporter substrate-binding protein [Rhodoblastus sp.]
MRSLSRRLFLAASAAALALPSSVRAAAKLRLAVQATGSFAWELATARAYGLDKAEGIDFETTQLATTEAGKVALIGGGADLILSDWLWVARERGLGTPLIFYPHSTALGAVMAKSAPFPWKASDLVGKKIGVAGGSLDKSWLLLQAWALKQGVDLKARAHPVFAAPPLLAEKLAQGELDAALEFFTFAARLEGKGFARAIDMADVERDLGAQHPLIVTGYVFTQEFAAKNTDRLQRFFAMMTKAKNLLADNDEAFAKIAPMTGITDPKTLAILRRYYRRGVPTATLAQYRADAAAIYKVLAEVGGSQLVGKATELDPGVFYRP